MKRRGRSPITRAEADVLESLRMLEQRGGEVTTADLARELRKQTPIVVEHLLNLKAQGRVAEQRSTDGLQRFWKRS